MKFPLAGALLALAIAALPADADDARPWQEQVLDGYHAFDPTAADTPKALATLIERGERLFKGKFVIEEGAGRPEATQAIIPTKRRRPAAESHQRLSGPDANSCQGCHFDPVLGAGAPFSSNAFVSEGFDAADFDTTDPQFSNERNSIALQGAGLVELLAREMTADLHRQRREALRTARRTRDPFRQALSSKGVSFGEITASPDGRIDLTKIEGIDSDLVIRPFSHKGVIVSLRQFAVNALNSHVGIEADERFGARWTGTADFDGDGREDEIGPGDISALVAFKATRPAPTRKTDLPEDWQQAAASGEALFSQIGCASCHIPALPLDSAVFEDPGPLDTAGTLRRAEVERPIRFDLAEFPWAKGLERDDRGRLLVPLFGDLKRHQISDTRNERLGNELIAQRFVDRDVFMTAELWGVGSTAPYGHRGDLTTLDEVILAHAGEATDARKAYTALQDADRQTIIAFLRSLEIAE
ncbi:hypothetical protein H2509_09805 [Stappia sp. F7233]|uniref:Cytochrome c domain-containing protein n=1 Tax=Stappia albiluteola TaxID=2758565 RepID=A0A839AEV2_9HYPH|nr:di-heme oxidoredictase family protein [Stappia albiluteola]MBA5777422.1 hypothetical protein [Stappia albiluteola]